MFKLAIVHDYLCTVGGSERVFTYICEEFPDADIFTLAYNPSKSFPSFSKYNIRTTILNRLVQKPGYFRLFFPIATYAMQNIDFSNYDIIFSFSATVAKYIRAPKGVHICYCLIPTRAIWHFNDYFDNGIKSKIFKILLPYLKKRDYQAAQLIDEFITQSYDAKNYIKEIYNRDAVIIPGPIETDKFIPSKSKCANYLIVSRLENWKRIDYAIEAFNRMDLPLRIIGVGSDETRLRRMAKPNIAFLGQVDDLTLIEEYGQAKAVIFTPFLEYGLIPLEANASGTPVICYGKGGVTETMIPYDEQRDQENSATAVYFYEQTAEALIKAIQIFESAQFKTDTLVKHAAKWSIESFKKSIRSHIQEVIKEH